MISNKKTISFIIAFTLTFCSIAILVGVLVFAQKTVPSTNALTSGVYTYKVSGSSATITDCSTSVSGSLSIPSSLGGYTVTSIGSSAFSYCRNLTSVTIPSSVTSIGNYAFQHCADLNSITIPNGVTSIGEYAFWYCDSLKTVNIPSSVTSIGQSAFSSCDGITSFSVNSGNSYYCSDSYGALYNKDKTILIHYPIGNTRTSFTIPSSVTTIGYEAFRNNNYLTRITIPSSVKTIEGYAFHGLNKLTSITIPNSVTTIEYRAFRMSNLTSITIPSSVKSIGSGIFEASTDLAKVTIQNGITSISSKAFYLCSSLTSVTIPSSVKSIGDSAFQHCDDLASITIPNSVTSIGDSAFDRCSSLTSITIPSSVTSIGDSAFKGCTKLTSFSVNSANSYYCSDNYGVLYNKSKTLLIQYPIGNTRSSFTIPSSVTSIGSSVFYKCSSLTNVTIPSSVTSIGSSAFYDCTNLSKVYYKGNINGWVEIVFGDTSSNPLSCGANLYINNTIVTTANITTATKIGTYAFYKYTKLTSVSIPSSVTSIGSSAFRYCSSLTSVTFYNKLTSASNIGGYAFANGSSSAVYYFAYKSTYDLAVSVGTSKFSSTDFRLMSFNLYTNSSGNGSVNSSINNPIVVGTQVTLTAEPNTGYHLEKWTDANGNQLSTNNTYTHMIDGGDATITAHFLVNTYTIVYNSNKPSGASGEITGSTANSAHTYGVGKNLTTNGYQLAKYNFKGWSTSPNGAVQYSDGQNVTNLSATNGATVNLYAVWELIVFTITVQVTPVGAGSVNGAGTYQVDEEVKLTAVPSGAYRFAYWADEQGNELSTNNPYTFNIEENLTVIANFELVTYNLTIKVNDASLGNVLYNNQVTSNLSISQTVNTQLNIFALANTGVAFLYWEVAENNTTVTQSSNPLVHILTSDCTITAVFGSGMVDGLAVTSRGGGQVRMGGYEDDGTDSTVNLYAVSYTDYQFDGWYITQNGVETKLEQFGNSTAISISVQDYDGKLIIAKFKLIKNDYANLEVDNS